MIKIKKRPLLYSTEFSEHVSLAGELITAESIILRGKFTGSLHSSSHVTIDRGAETGPCSVEARSLSLCGKFSGAASAVEWIDVVEGAEVGADLHAPEIRISESARFEGRVGMERNRD